MPADDLTDPAPATSFAHLDATTVLSRSIAEKGIYPAVDPLDSTSRMLSALIVGEEHCVALPRQSTLQRYKTLQDIIAILGMDELSEEDKLIVARAPPQDQALPVATFPRNRGFSRNARRVRRPGRHHQKDSRGSSAGEYDHLPEQAFYMVGTIEAAVEKAKKLAEAA